MSFILIETLQDLNYLNKELLLKSHVGIDTEFKRFTKEKITIILLDRINSHCILWALTQIQKSEI